MANKIRVIVALVVIVGVVFWSVNLVRERTYSGSKFAFKVGSGSVVVTNQGQQPIPVEMRMEGRGTSFRIESAELGLKQASKRQGTGRDTYHFISFELPPGQARIDVTRGSHVQFISSSNQRIDAVVTTISQASVRSTIIFTVLVILGALYYISNTVKHQWIWAVRHKVARRKQQPKGVAP